jgi:hypothetical protein
VSDTEIRDPRYATPAQLRSREAACCLLLLPAVVLHLWVVVVVVAQYHQPVTDI